MKQQPVSLMPGDEVEDRITGFRGIVVCRTEWLYGCVRLTIQPRKLVKGKQVDACTFDEPQLILVKTAAVKAPLAAGDPDHGPRDDTQATSRN